MDFDFDWSDFDWPDFNSRYLGLTLNNTSPLLSSTFLKSHHLLPLNEIYQPPPHDNTHRFPPVIFSEIFLYTIQANPRSQRHLMLVCRHWHDIMLSTPGIHSQLRIDRSTTKKDVERFGKRWLLDVTVDIQNMTFADRRYEADFNPVEFYACFMAAAEAAPRWRSLILVSFPPPEGYENLQLAHPLLHLESFKLAASCNLGNFLEPLITAITTTATPRFTVMEVFHPDAAFTLVQPAHFQIFSSITTLRLSCRRMQNPVDILPSLHKLEILEAHHLSLPIYSLTVNLPLTQILRVLYLKCVSIQWMTGRIFPALEECSIIFPHYADGIQSVHMPSCSILKYVSNNLGTLERFHHSPLARLEVKCGQWSTWRGNSQLAVLHRIFEARSLTCLHLEIRCSERLLAHMLGLVPALEELWMGLSSPHALSSTFFLVFAAEGRNASARPLHQISPLCRQLRLLHLHYKRWLRGAERNRLIPAFGAIVASHTQNFSFRLSIGEGPQPQEWIVHEPVVRLDVRLESDRTFIGVSSPHGIVPLSSLLIASEDGHGAPSLFTEAEYISTRGHFTLPIDFLLSHPVLIEVRMPYSSLDMGANIPLSPNAHFFHLLKVFAVWSTPSSFLGGQTFHKLERYKEQRNDCEVNPDQGSLTEMPACTRLIAPLSRVATFKLPQVSELVTLIDHEKLDNIWEKHIAVNTNLSGLRLLHLGVNDDYLQLPIIDIIKILESLPALETLVLDGKYLVFPYGTFFDAFIPMNASDIPALNQPSWEGQISKVLCPRLESLQVGDISLTEQSELMPALKDIVTLRAGIGSPLKSFTFYFPGSPEKKWELIGRDGGFIMEEVVPAVRFQLDI